MIKRVLAITVLTVLIFGGVFSEVYAVKVRLWFDSQGGAAQSVLGPLSPISSIHQAPQKLMTIMLPPTPADSMSLESETGEAALVDLPSSLGATVSYEYVSIGDDDCGNVYGLSGSYERKWGKIRGGGLLSYKYHDIDVSGFDFSSNLIGALFYGTYLVLDAPVSLLVGVNAQVDRMILKEDFIDDYTSGGGGLFFTVGKDFGPVEVTGGFSYNYGAMDIDLDEDEAHLLKYGLIVGMPIAEAFSVNAFVTDTRNVTNYDVDVEDDSYVCLGTEGTWHVAGSWVVAVSYKTILGIDEFDSHEIYLGTIRKF